MLGETCVSEDELFDGIDVNRAIDALTEADINNASTRVHRFISSIPALLEWFEENGRQYPWRETTDPWTIYATEILLQRTRADAVDSIYRQFFERFETPDDLYNAPENVIRETVRSLGFVNHRIRTLNEAVEMICVEYDGNVPESIEALKKPWRVGDYTARAVCTFAYGEPLALVDTNFARVFGRILGYDMPEQPHKSSEVYRILDSIIPKDGEIARAYNLAILDLGALICTPSNPACRKCPLSDSCSFFLAESE